MVKYFQKLEQMVVDGRFRKDLLFRLNVVRIMLPPLRAREEDIAFLMDHFLNTFTQEFGKKVESFNRESLQLLKNYSYPGNVRELRNIIEYAVNVCQETQIKPENLPTYFLDLTDHSAEPAPQNTSSYHLSATPTPEEPAADNLLCRNRGLIEVYILTEPPPGRHGACGSKKRSAAPHGNKDNRTADNARQDLYRFNEVQKKD